MTITVFSKPDTAETGRGGERPPLVFIDGVASQSGMVKAQEHLGVKIEVPRDCEYACAPGAAPMGLRHPETLT